jgi:hypothetical protein
MHLFAAIIGLFAGAFGVMKSRTNRTRAIGGAGLIIVALSFIPIPYPFANLTVAVIGAALGFHAANTGKVEYAQAIAEAD